MLAYIQKYSALTEADIIELTVVIDGMPFTQIKTSAWNSFVDIFKHRLPSIDVSVLTDRAVYAELKDNKKEGVDQLLDDVFIDAADLRKKWMEDQGQLTEEEQKSFDDNIDPYITKFSDKDDADVIRLFADIP